MLHAQTLDKLNQLKLYGMVQAIETHYQHSEPSDISPSELLTLLTDAECSYRDTKKTKRLVAGANFKEKEACIEALDFRGARGLKKATVMELTQNQWIKNHQNIFITGPSGSGKSFFAQALGNHCARHGYSVTYLRMPKLMFYLLEVKARGGYLDYLKKLAKIPILILDDWGITPIGEQDHQDLLEIIEDRHQIGSTILTSQLPVSGWHQYLGGGLAAEAILDRLFHSTHRFELRTHESLRKEQPPEKEKLTQSSQSEK
jgi:DNA replication protein DnaC